MKYTPRLNFDDISDTEWEESAKGNYWRKCQGTMLIVGGSYQKGFWIRVDNKFLPAWEASLESAKTAAENEVE